MSWIGDNGVVFLFRSRPIAEQSGIHGLSQPFLHRSPRGCHSLDAGNDYRSPDHGKEMTACPAGDGLVTTEKGGEGRPSEGAMARGDHQKK